MTEAWLKYTSSEVYRSPQWPRLGALLLTATHREAKPL
jgi:hypothetical protein